MLHACAYLTAQTLNTAFFDTVRTAKFLVHLRKYRLIDPLDRDFELGRFPRDRLIGVRVRKIEGQLALLARGGAL
jgi:hypothetical protein